MSTFEVLWSTGELEFVVAETELEARLATRRGEVEAAEIVYCARLEPAR